MPSHIAQSDIKAVVYTVVKQTNTIEDNLKKVVKMIENSSASATFFKPNERVARVKACQQVIAPLAETSAQLASSLGMVQGQGTALSGG
jgi:hypothetical protein